MINRGALLGFLCLILVLGISFSVSAACINTNQTIMRLSSATNAHGAVWNDASYSTDICFNTIFGFNYNGTDPHPTCAAGNTNNVVRLSAPTNAHGENFSLTQDYQTLVCHSGLKECEFRTDSCPAGKSAIVWLSGNTNAHLARDRIPASDYPYVVCCKNSSGGTGTPGTPSDVPTKCADYNISGKTYYGQANCDADANTFKASYTDPDCLGKQTCGCKWTSGRCNFVFTNKVGSCVYSCTLEAIGETACLSNEKQVDVKATPVTISGDCSGITTYPGCESGQRPAPCGFDLSELPFFGGLQFAAAILAIGVIYLVFLYRRK